LTSADQPNGSRAVAVRGLVRTADDGFSDSRFSAAKMMLLAVIKALVQEHIEHCNFVWIFLLSIAVTFVVADGPLTSILQTCASILAVVCVLLGSAVTE